MNKENIYSDYPADHIPFIRLAEMNLQPLTSFISNNTLTSTSLISDSVHCNDGSLCPPDTTCCIVDTTYDTVDTTNAVYGCCPFPDATCCANKSYCCPADRKCNERLGTCDFKVPKLEVKP